MCIILTVVPVFDASLVKAQLDSVCKELWLGEVVCCALSPNHILVLKVYNATSNSPKVTEQDS